ncbi:MAG: hypothetical protein ABIR53_04105 [Paraperlucidibaca sp.]
MMTCQQVCQHALMPPQRLSTWQAFWRFLHLLMCGRCRLALRQFKLMLSTTALRQDPAPSAEQVARWLQGIEAEQDRAPRLGPQHPMSPPWR